MRTITNPNKNLKFIGNKGADQPYLPKPGNELYGDASKITGVINARLLRGDLSGLEGDISGITGDVTNIHGKIHPLLFGEVMEGLSGDISGIYGFLTSFYGGITGDATNIYGNITNLRSKANFNVAWPPRDRLPVKVSIKELLDDYSSLRYNEDFPVATKIAILKQDGFINTNRSRKYSAFSVDEYLEAVKSK